MIDPDPGASKPMPGGTSNNTKVDVREFYKALNDMERRIMAELKGLPRQVETNKEEIEKLRSRSDTVDIALVVTTAFGSLLAAIFGTRQ